MVGGHFMAALHGEGGGVKYVELLANKARHTSCMNLKTMQLLLLGFMVKKGDTGGRSEEVAEEGVSPNALFMVHVEPSGP